MSIRLPNEIEVPPGPRRQLLCDLRVLYDAAGRPSTRQISNWTRQDPEVTEISPDLVSRVLRGSVPRWKNLESLVRVLLAHPAIDTAIGIPEEHLRRVHKIWVLADDGGRPGAQQPTTEPARAQRQMSAPARNTSSESAIPDPNGRLEDPRLSEQTRAAPDSDVQMLYYELARARKGPGLAWDNLEQRSRSGLLHIPALRQLIAMEHDDPVASVIGLVVDSVRQMPISDRLVADVVLGLRLHSAEFSELDRRVLYRLYGDSLGLRRDAMRNTWRLLHAALGVDEPPPAPSDRRLRTVLEEEILRDLARRVLRPREAR